jgi:GNAT superfamily N-acetyltransferase
MSRSVVKNIAITIRRSAESDIPALFQIRTAVRENHMTLAELAAADVTADSVSTMLGGKHAAAWIGFDGETPLGFSMARADVGDVFALFVLPEAEGLGLGTKLLAEAECWLAFRDVTNAWLLTGGEPGLRAPGFYLKRGWVCERREADGQIRFTKQLKRHM